MTKIEKLANIFAYGFFLGVIFFVFRQFSHGAFRPHIAECRQMNDVTKIVEGRLHNKNKKLSRENKFLLRAYNRDRIGPLPEPIYVFKSTHAWKGISGFNRIKHHGWTYVIREGEAAEGALGKKALICFKGNRPLTIKSIYIAE